MPILSINSNTAMQIISGNAFHTTFFAEKPNEAQHVILNVKRNDSNDTKEITANSSNVIM